MVSGDEVRFGLNGCLPAHDRRVARAKVIIFIPSLVFIRSIAVETIKADQVTELVAVIDKLLETLIFFL